jgi:succinate dehydrogenase / fumarate reductase membrane anchor subunit
MRTDTSRWSWVLQSVSGLALIVLLGLHWTAQHYLATGGLRSYSEVVAYLREPVALVLELAFLAVVTGHALLGIRAIIADIGLRPAVQRSVDLALWTAGLMTVLYGLQLTWQIIRP